MAWLDLDDSSREGKAVFFFADAWATTPSDVLAYMIDAVESGAWIAKGRGRIGRPATVYALVAGERITAEFDLLAFVVRITSGRLAGTRYSLPSEAALAVLREYDPERVPVRIDGGWFWLRRNGKPYAAWFHERQDAELRTHGTMSGLHEPAWGPRVARVEATAPRRDRTLHCTRCGITALRWQARGRLRPPGRNRGVRRTTARPRRLTRLPHRPRPGGATVPPRGLHPAQRLILRRPDRAVNPMKES